MTNWMVFLWAQQGRFRPLGEGNPGESSPLELDGAVVGVIVLAVASVALWTIWQYVARKERARRAYSPQHLFRQLCQAHGLDRAERKVLGRLVEQQGLEHPGRVFLEPERFDGDSGPMLVKIKERLFAEVDAATAEVS